MHACMPPLQGGHLEVVKTLLDAKAMPNPTKIAHTALRAAAIYGHHGVIGCLLLAKVWLIRHTHDCTHTKS